MGAKQSRQRQLEGKIFKLNGRIAAIEKRNRRLMQVRVWSFIAGALVSGVTFVTLGAWPWLLITPIVFVPFGVGVVVQQRVDGAISRWQTWLNIQQSHLTRMNLDWAELPQPFAIPIAKDHPFAVDVDLLGPYSLHRLLDTAVSQSGKQRLADWLLEQAPDSELIAKRQQQVTEMSEMTHFRDKLTLNGKLVTAQSEEQIPGEQLVAWLNLPADRKLLRRWTLILSGLALLTIVLFLLESAHILPSFWLASWVVYVGLYVSKGLPLTGALFHDGVRLQNGLDRLQGVFHFLESFRYGRYDQIRAICHLFLDESNKPSAHIRRVRRVMTGIGLRQHPIIGLLVNAVVPWDMFFAYRLALCKVDLRGQLPSWIDSWFELEALSSLATFAYLNVGDVVFPKLDTAVTVQFDAKQLGHPLIQAEKRVCNDFTVTTPGSVTIITGSNMAGKSSFLRTMGINLVLAYAGSAVVAQAFSTSYFRLFASIRVQDSLTDGYSFFYAEVRRLAQLLEALQEEEKRPLFFLIDEIFRGTNNKERLIGSRAYIEALAQGQGVGMIATHDLELVHLADDCSTIQNYHFRDGVENGRMVFDYKLHKGPCPTTNALKIMQLAGLPVPTH